MSYPSSYKHTSLERSGGCSSGLYASGVGLCDPLPLQDLQHLTQFYKGPLLTPQGSASPLPLTH
jgi:hypothetical protein